MKKICTALPLRWGPTVPQGEDAVRVTATIFPSYDFVPLERLREALL